MAGLLRLLRPGEAAQARGQGANGARERPQGYREGHRVVRVVDPVDRGRDGCPAPAGGVPR